MTRFALIFLFVVAYQRPAAADADILINGRPGYVVRAGGFEAVFVKLDKVKAWNDAERACADFAPRGEWTLPAAHAVLLSVESGVNRGIEVEGARIYPMWARYRDAARNEREFRDKAVVISLGADRQFPADKIDVVETVAQLRSILAHEDLNSDLKRKLSVVVAILADGWPVYCVKGVAD